MMIVDESLWRKRTNLTSHVAHYYWHIALFALEFLEHVLSSNSTMFNKVLTPNLVMDQLYETSPGISINNACNLAAMFAINF